MTSGYYLNEKLKIWRATNPHYTKIVNEFVQFHGGSVVKII